MKLNTRKVFRQLLDELKPGLDEGKAYDITSLTERYREILDEKGIASEVYQQFKQNGRKKVKIVSRKPLTQTKSGP